MDVLTSEEGRVLGCLIEKQMSTPESYPMTVNALVTASNQRTSRDPVMTLDSEAVESALRGLNDRGLSRFTRSSGARTLKYVHKTPEALEIDDYQTAVIGVLLLRGPQTVGEVRGRTDRWASFANLEAVESVIVDLMTRDVPLVRRLEREPGHKEHRYRTVLSDYDGTKASVGAHRPSRLTDELAAELAAIHTRLSRIEEALGLSPET